MFKNSIPDLNPVEDGIILIDKPTGISSFGVVNVVRKNLSAHFGKKIKVGHTGTLDPFASGLMILVVGKECKSAQNYSKLDKTYEANIELGKISSTGDVEGELKDFSDTKPSLEDIKKTISKFEGEIEQKPPKFSAIKIAGKRAYDLARKGEEFDLPSRKVTINSIEIIDYNYPFLKLRVDVSSGTYIRSLAEDIGSDLGTGAYCKDLRRISIDRWTIDSALNLVQSVV